MTLSQHLLSSGVQVQCLRLYSYIFVPSHTRQIFFSSRCRSVFIFWGAEWPLSVTGYVVCLWLIFYEVIRKRSISDLLFYYSSNYYWAPYNRYSKNVEISRLSDPSQTESLHWSTQEEKVPLSTPIPRILAESPLQKKIKTSIHQGTKPLHSAAHEQLAVS